MAGEADDEEAAWRDLIAQYSTPAAADGVAPWPVREELSGARPALPGPAGARGPIDITDEPGVSGTPGTPDPGTGRASGVPGTAGPGTPGPGTGRAPGTSSPAACRASGTSSPAAGRASGAPGTAAPGTAAPGTAAPGTPGPGADRAPGAPATPDPGSGRASGNGPQAGPRADGEDADTAQPPPGGWDPVPGVIPAPPRTRIVRPAVPAPLPPVGDDEHYVPPAPPPLPRLDPVSKGAWVALFGGPGYLLLAVLLGWVVPSWAGFCAVAAFVGGFATLVVRMGDRPPGDSGSDDGAVV